MSMGYRVLSACDGQEALKLCSQETPALAILDVIMPKLGGSATAASLLEMLPDLPIVFTSGYSADSNEVSTAGGKARYLRKPYSPNNTGTAGTRDLGSAPRRRAVCRTEAEGVLIAP
jgi:CheY-like chemotaxis protein